MFSHALGPLWGDTGYRRSERASSSFSEDFLHFKRVEVRHVHVLGRTPGDDPNVRFRPVADFGLRWHQVAVESQKTFLVPLTAFQQVVLERLGSDRLADLQGTPVVLQHPYIRPQPGAGNQYLTVEWDGQLRLYIYDDEIGFDGFTLERFDFATDEAQIEAMIEEIKHMLANGS